MRDKSVCPRPVVTRRDLILGSGAGFLASRLPASPAVFDEKSSFLAVGDWGRSGGDYQLHVARHMEREARRLNSQFVVSTGDNFYVKGVSTACDDKWNTAFEDIYTDSSLQRPWYPVLGNHDYGGNVWAQIERSEISPRWRMPKRWHKVSLDRRGRPHADLFFIDTIAWTGGEDFPWNVLGTSVTKKDRADHKDWLVGELLGSTAPIKLVFGHYPVFSVGEHGGKKKLDDLDRLLRKAGVTAYVNGHDHCLYHIRTDQMDYVGSGGGSQEMHKYTGGSVFRCVLPLNCGAETDQVEALPKWMSYSDRAGFASFTISDTSVEFTLIDRNGTRFHNHVLGVRAPDATVVLT